MQARARFNTKMCIFFGEFSIFSFHFSIIFTTFAPAKDVDGKANILAEVQRMDSPAMGMGEKPVPASVASVFRVVPGAAGGGEAAERGIARAHHGQTRRALFYGNMGLGLAEYLLHHVASDLASGVYDERLSQRTQETLSAAFLHVLCPYADLGADGVGAGCAAPEEPRYDDGGL